MSLKDKCCSNGKYSTRTFFKISISSLNEFSIKSDFSSSPNYHQTRNCSCIGVVHCNTTRSCCFFSQCQDKEPEIFMINRYCLNFENLNNTFPEFLISLDMSGGERWKTILPLMLVIKSPGFIPLFFAGVSSLTLATPSHRPFSCLPTTTPRIF